MFIKNINLKNIASYDNNGASLITDKPINLIYGLNGTGKTTISRYLSDYNNKDIYQNCSLITNNIPGKVIAFNQDFIRLNFHEDEIPGIFTIAQPNIEANQAIEQANTKISENNLGLENTSNQQQQNKTNENNLKAKLKEQIWSAITEYPKHTAVGKLCLEGYYNNKNKFAEDLLKIQLPDKSPDIEELIKVANQLSNDETHEIAIIKQFDETELLKIENDEIFQSVIVGNENSSIKTLVEKLNNSKWVEDGLLYIDASDNKCPFCQQELSAYIVQNIHDFFDETYRDNINKISKLKNYYQESANSFESYTSTLLNNIFVAEDAAEFNQLCQNVKILLKKNSNKIEAKVKEPNIKINLDSSSNTLQLFYSFLSRINKKIEEHNSTIRNRQQSTRKIKEDFWKYLRFRYQGDINDYHTNIRIAAQSIESCEEKERLLKEDNQHQQIIIRENQAKTINIQKTIRTINDNLKWLGLSGFQLSEHSEHKNKYRLIRENKDASFITLSEGEKTIITFLYFIELSKGKLSIEATNEPKVVIIDDPISSLSHNYVFHIAQLIKDNFFTQVLQENSNISQLFILTHNLYFFNELLNPLIPNHSRYKDKYKMFRVIKYKFSNIIELGKNEIQNDYQAYWQVIKDCQSEQKNPILVANSMRNILEHFFGFVYKQKIDYLAKLDNKYEVFQHYINRESHSYMGSISDVKDINIELFLEAFKSVFETLDFQDHYQAMMGVVNEATS